MDYSRFSGEMPSDSFVLNAKLALQLADDTGPTLANLQVDDTGNRVLLRHKSKSTPSLLRPSSKAGWARIQDLFVVLWLFRSLSDTPTGMRTATVRVHRMSLQDHRADRPRMPQAQQSDFSCAVQCESPRTPPSGY